MSDVHQPQIRSFNMRQIKGRDTKPEMLVRRFLYKNGFRFRLHYKGLPGKPDIVLPKYKVIVDVRGCFWHNHEGCKYGDQIATPSKVISERRRTAVERDQRNEKLWIELGWRVFVLWERCELEARRKNSAIRNSILNDLRKELHQIDTYN